MFLGKYKMMKASDSRLIYGGSKDYHRKRLKVLEKEKYIRRVNRLYIKLDDKGTKMVKDFGYDYSFNCRKKSYIERLNEIARIAALSINSSIEFIPSWELKDYTIYTQTSRKYIGKLYYQKKYRIAYYISKDKQISYISQTLNDINKITNYDDIVLFIEDMDLLDRQKFIFTKESCLIINPTQVNLDFFRELETIDIYQIVQDIYKEDEILLSNWKKADYMLDNKTYIIFMPFIDTMKLRGLNIFFKNNQKTNRKIDIITLKENKEKIIAILKGKVNTIELDNFLGGKDEKGVFKT